MKLSRLLMLAPVLNLTESLFDNLFHKTNEPVRGSIVYCDLAFGYAEHSGIYIGNDKIVHRNKKGIAEVVSSRQFVADTTAITIYVSCDCHGKPVGEEGVALLAEAHIGQEGDYALLGYNCHQFCGYCLTGNACNNTSLLSLLKKDARLCLDATQWRAWNLLRRP